MEILVRCGTEEQKARWLVPLLEGRIRSCFAMTEPRYLVLSVALGWAAAALCSCVVWVPRNSNQNVLSLVQVASSDASNIEASIKEEDGSYVLNGHKWWTSGTAGNVLLTLVSLCRWAGL